MLGLLGSGKMRLVSWYILMQLILMQLACTEALALLSLFAVISTPATPAFGGSKLSLKFLQRPNHDSRHMTRVFDRDKDNSLRNQLLRLCVALRKLKQCCCVNVALCCVIIVTDNY